MEFKDYYQILGLSDQAQAAEIKSAYRKLARRYHPDVSREENAEEKFKEVTEAYEVLKDPEKRAEYDQLRTMGARTGDGRFRPPPGWESAAQFGSGGFTDVDAAGFSDFFDAIFGRSGTAHRTYRQGRQQSFSMRGEDLHTQLSLFLEEAHRGVERQLDIQVPEVDDYGLVSHRPKTLKVKIPAGVYDGQIIRLRGQGASGIGGGPAGDLFIEIRLAPHPLYSISGKDLMMTLPVAPWEAALGGNVNIPTLGGVCQLKIPPGSNAGHKLRLKGRGLPGSPPGNLIVSLKIVMPDKQTARSNELFKTLSEELAFDPRKGMGV